MPVHIRLLSFCLPYKRRFLIAWLCTVGATAFTLATPWLLQYAIDQGLGLTRHATTVADKEIVSFSLEGSTRTLVIAALLLVTTAILRGLFTYGQTYLSEWLSQRVAYDIRNQIYQKIQRLSFAYHDNAQTGQIMSRATQDVEGVRMYVSMGLLRLVSMVMLVVGAVVMMAWNSWLLMLVSWAFVPPVLIVSVRMANRLRPIWLSIQDLQGRLGTVLQENLSGQRVVKAFGRENIEHEKFAAEANHLFEVGYASNRIQAVSSPILSGIWMMAIVVTAWFGAREIANGNMTAGTLTMFIFLLQIIQFPIRMLGFIVILWARAQSSGERIYEILDAESAVKEKPQAVELASPKGYVTFENVSFAYDTISPVLRDVDLEAKPGEVIALLGPTGSGKTTIVNLMPRFYDVTKGRICIDDTDIRDVTLASLRRCFGIVQQEVFLFTSTIHDNIAYGVGEATQDEIERAAKAARIHDFIASLPDGYDTWVGERGMTLSGGQKQRIAIARTLLMDPRILVFDDSTSSVDTETEYLIQQALAELMKGRTTFVIAQRLRTVKSADRILVLKDGRIVEQGRHHELIKAGGLYREIYDLELRDQEEALERARRDGTLESAPSPAG